MEDLPGYSDHEKAIAEIAKKHNLEERIVRNMVNRFFWRIRIFINNQISFPIPELGDVFPNELGKEIKDIKHDRSNENQLFDHRRALLLKKYGKKALK